MTIDPAIIQALSTIIAAVIAGITSVAVAHIQSSAKSQPTDKGILIPDGVKIHRNPGKPIGWIIAFTLAGGGVGYFLGGVISAGNSPPTSTIAVSAYTSTATVATTLPPTPNPSPTQILSSTFTPAPTNSPVPTQTPLPPTQTPLPLLQKTISVSGIPYWQRNGVSVLVGQQVEISYVSGAWCGGAGYCYDGNGAWFQRIQLGVNLENINWASLVGRIESGGVYYAFPVGNYLKFVAANSGQLEFRMNDDDGSSDNSGQIEIMVRIWK